VLNSETKSKGWKPWNKI